MKAKKVTWYVGICYIDGDYSLADNEFIPDLIFSQFYYIGKTPESTINKLYKVMPDLHDWDLGVVTFKVKE